MIRQNAAVLASVLWDSWIIAYGHFQNSRLLVMTPLTFYDQRTAISDLISCRTCKYNLDKRANMRFVGFSFDINQHIFWQLIIFWWSYPVAITIIIIIMCTLNNQIYGYSNEMHNFNFMINLNLLVYPEKLQVNLPVQRQIREDQLPRLAGLFVVT